MAKKLRKPAFNEVVAECNSRKGECSGCRFFHNGCGPSMFIEETPEEKDNDPQEEIKILKEKLADAEQREQWHMFQLTKFLLMTGIDRETTKMWRKEFERSF